MPITRSNLDQAQLYLGRAVELMYDARFREKSAVLKVLDSAHRRVGQSGYLLGNSVVGDLSTLRHTAFRIPDAEARAEIFKGATEERIADALHKLLAVNDEEYYAAFNPVWLTWPPR